MSEDSTDKYASDDFFLEDSMSMYLSKKKKKKAEELAKKATEKTEDKS